MQKTILLGLLLLAFKSSIACDCEPRSISYKDALNEYIKDTPIIIKIKVIETQKLHRLNQTQEYLDSLSQRHLQRFYQPVLVNQYTVLVEEKYKGKITTDTITLRTGTDPVLDCGLELEEGKSYILFAYPVIEGSRYSDLTQNRQVISSNRCTSTRLFSFYDERILKQSVYISPKVPK